MPKLVSIIIPIFNRAHLIGETLNSIIKQTYSNWEVLVIDDRSTDKTKKVVEFFTLQDSRINYFLRPVKHPRGANSCRNYGLLKSNGQYIIWFDSDDLMTPIHLQSKVSAMENCGCDFAIGRTRNFKDGEFLEPYKYEKKSYGIKASDFVLLKIHWYTYDVILKNEIAELLHWHERMKSWQDYDYFCKMLLVTERGVYIDEVLTHRRIHSASIQAALTENQLTFRSELLQSRLLTYEDISERLDQNTRNELVYGLMNLSFELVKNHFWTGGIYETALIVRKRLGILCFLFFFLSLIASFALGKGHLLLSWSKGRY